VRRDELVLFLFSLAFFVFVFFRVGEIGNSGSRGGGAEEGCGRVGGRRWSARRVEERELFTRFACDLCVAALHCLGLWGVYFQFCPRRWVI